VSAVAFPVHAAHSCAVVAGITTPCKSFGLKPGGCYGAASERGLTPRSTRDPPRPAGLPGRRRLAIVRRPGKPAARSGRVSANVRPQKRRAVELRIYLGILLACVTGVAWISYALYALGVEPVAFDSASWSAKRELANDMDPGCVRGGMAATLISDGRLLGRTHEQAVSVLGRPDRLSAEGVIYALGQCHGLGWWHSELVVSIDGAGKVARLQARVSR